MNLPDFLNDFDEDFYKYYGSTEDDNDMSLQFKLYFTNVNTRNSHIVTIDLQEDNGRKVRSYPRV